VSGGDGPIDVDTATDTISSASRVPLSVLRASGRLTIGTAGISIAAAGTTEPA
jgi:hypothetical protein